MSLAKLGIAVLIPLGLFLGVLTAALWSLARGRTRAAAALMLGAMVGVLVAAMPITARWTASQLESQLTPLSIEQAPNKQAIVVLCGGIAGPPTQGAVSLGPEADRLWLGTLLWRSGKAPLVVISGDGNPPEAELAARLLTEWSVPAESLLLETTSVNTRQNATATQALLSPLGIREILLVTTAIHMPRAAASFRNVGFSVTPFAVDFRSWPPLSRLSIRNFLPQVAALSVTSDALLEWIAGYYYQLRGWA